MSPGGAVGFVLVAILQAASALAHDARPIFVEIRESPHGHVDVRWKVPPVLPVAAAPIPVLPASCTPQGEPAQRKRAGMLGGRQSYSCPDGLAGGTLALRFPAANPSLSTVFRVTLASGELHSRILRPGTTSWRLAEPPTRLGVAREYTWLGVRHIAAGFDHLLFIACLLFIAGTARRILLTITGFTLAHSLTLALSVLGWVRLPVPPVEAAIALSILFLAVEIAGKDRRSLTWRYPVAVSASFGLLHGFGFAAVLGEIGLPAGELPTALLSFNVGVELGQLGFLALLAPFLWWAGRDREPEPDLGALEPVRIPACYVIGTLASYWFVERVAGFAG